MASKKSYSRYFIILQEDERGYGLAPGKIPTGYAKIEVKNSKCKVSYYVQNLKPDNNRYCMILICGKKGCQSLINMGDIMLDEQGRADVSYEYDVENIGNTSIASDKIVGASISRVVDSNVISLMSGFTTTEIPNDWKRYKIVEVNNGINDKDVRKENIFDKYENKIEEIKKDSEEKVVSKDIEKTHSTDKVDTDKVQKVDKEIVEKVEEEKEIKENEIRECDENTQEGCNIEKQECNLEKIEDEFKNRDVDIQNDIGINEEKYENRKNKSCNECTEKFFENLMKDMKKYCDIFPNIKKSVWYKVDVKDVDDMCDMSDYDKYVIVYYPMINYYAYIKEHKHYLVGFKYDEDCKIKYMMYAIPGSKSSKCQPFSGKTGFVTWMKSSNMDENEGYWIMFYDFKNCNILIPMKKNK